MRSLRLWSVRGGVWVVPCGGDAPCAVSSFVARSRVVEKTSTKKNLSVLTRFHQVLPCSIVDGCVPRTPQKPNTHRRNHTAAVYPLHRAPYGPFHTLCTRAERQRRKQCHHGQSGRRNETGGGSSFRRRIVEGACCRTAVSIHRHRHRHLYLVVRGVRCEIEIFTPTSTGSGPRREVCDAWKR